MPEEKRRYRVRPGFTFGARDEFGQGAVVELTPYEAGGFLDKLEEVEDEIEVEVKAEAISTANLVMAEIGTERTEAKPKRRKGNG